MRRVERRIRSPDGLIRTVSTRPGTHSLGPTPGTVGVRAMTERWWGAQCEGRCVPPTPVASAEGRDHQGLTFEAHRAPHDGGRANASLLVLQQLHPTSPAHE